MNTHELIHYDQQHVCHPYTSMTSALQLPLVEYAQACTLTLNQGEGSFDVVDGMASWWCAIHGYNHPVINNALNKQTTKFSHIMFGGLTHEPAIRLAKTLVDITSPSLQHVFFSDSGSVSVEVAMKMALQYWQAKKQSNKNTFLTVKRGYHGDTFATMSVCDPVNGMHHLFTGSLKPQLFAQAPHSIDTAESDNSDIDDLRNQLEQHHHNIAAIILEPIVQGAGGMRFYRPDYLKQVRTLCDKFNVLLILDEIATGFGRTGKLFAYEHAEIEADILCLGKALTGGTMTLAATLTTPHIAETISNSEANCFMHGPTFMANPLACTAANASLELLLNSDWHTKVLQIESQFKTELLPLKSFDCVEDVRVLGAIGVIEMKKPLDMQKTTNLLLKKGVWLRPFGKLLYSMPPFIIKPDELTCITQAMKAVVESVELNNFE